MAKILKLSEAQSEILDQLFFLDENDAEDEEEINRLKKELLKIRTDAYGTLEFLSGLLLESKALLAGREEVKKRAERRRKTAENACNRLDTIIKIIMSRFEIQKVDLHDCSLRLQRTPGKLVYKPGFDCATLPKGLFKIEATPIASAITAAIKEGAVFDDVELVQTDSLRIG